MAVASLSAAKQLAKHCFVLFRQGVFRLVIYHQRLDNPSVLIYHKCARPNVSVRRTITRARMPEKKRNYRKEYDDFHGTPKQRKLRSMRNKARRKVGLKKGDPREVDHKKPLSKGGGNGRKNLRAVSRSTNRRKGAK